jgi:hypothetical protein
MLEFCIVPNREHIFHQSDIAADERFANDVDFIPERCEYPQLFLFPLDSKNGQQRFSYPAPAFPTRPTPNRGQAYPRGGRSVPRSPAVMSNSTQQQEPREDQKGLAWRAGYVLGCLTLVAIVVVGIYSLTWPQEKPITYVPVNEIPKEQAAEETPAPPPVATPDAPTAVASGVAETASATSRAGETAREDHHRHSN